MHESTLHRATPAPLQPRASLHMDTMESRFNARQPKGLDWLTAVNELSAPESMLVAPTPAQSVRYPACLRSLRWQIAATDTMLGRD